MATIVILEHEVQRHLPLQSMVYLFVNRWRENGHRVLVQYGTENPPSGDIAILHIDLTVVPAEYYALLSLYPRVINGAVLDISKRTFSQNIVQRGSEWNGPVILKTDANFGGHPERYLRERATRAGVRSGIPKGPMIDVYPIFSSPRAVPRPYWRMFGFIVEKFLPEQDERGYYLRVWSFFGDRERSTRYRAAVPVIKSHNFLDSEPVPVPDEIRAWRKQLHFDFGKFDYVCHEGRPILLDANRTPGAPSNLAANPEMQASMDSLAKGIQKFLS